MEYQSVLETLESPAAANTSTPNASFEATPVPSTSVQPTHFEIIGTVHPVIGLPKVDECESKEIEYHQDLDIYQQNFVSI